MLELLISKGSDINKTDIHSLNIMLLFFINQMKYKRRILPKKNLSLLHYVARFNLKEVGEILISKGADINAQNIIYGIILIKFLINVINN